ncbi:threonine ammonia-lyase IlvA [Pseudohoeflea coraliihabitans]|uniref:L-threonine dehydratase n=1 Tax=Pseudohoeflea coraliihabitans TaxID=2860393 RepID=A0ABS6WS93_9HYPH|nr:threonine ammonia-lyase IlvA [Pseudohoeflea sp. DP4N28-3]MBW3098828.1 threonine ammonia-lyase IlvA [Pseudohoeflea sp. DP4N28-3]
MHKTQSPAEFRTRVDEALTPMRALFPATPLQLNDHLSSRYNARVWLKREDLTPVRSYKIRGAFNFLRKVIDSAGAAAPRFVCASAGNHAQGFAFACRHFACPGVVFMPVTTPQQKIDKTRLFGGEYIEIRLVGDIFDTCYAAARDYAVDSAAMMVPPFDHADIVEGQATVAAEILDQLPEGEEAELIVLPVGGGGLSAGVTAYLDGLQAEDSFVFVEPQGAPSLAASLEAGARTKLAQIDNFVDGAAVAEIGALNFEMLRHFDRAQTLTVAENAICMTITEMLNTEGIVLEPAGALALSALEVMAPERLAGKSIILVVSGGNFDFDRLPDVKERAMRHAGLKKYFILRMAQRPGALRDFLELLGPEDDISRFEYLKKSARNFGSILIGIETRKAENFIRLRSAFDDAGLNYQDITDNDILSNLII